MFSTLIEKIYDIIISRPKSSTKSKGYSTKPSFRISKRSHTNQSTYKGSLEGGKNESNKSSGDEDGDDPNRNPNPNRFFIGDKSDIRIEDRLIYRQLLDILNELNSICYPATNIEQARPILANLYVRLAAICITLRSNYPK
jgi:hypothetical protein